MKKSLYKNSLVIGIILLFVGASVLPSTVSTIDKKISFQELKSPGYIQDLIDNASDGDTIYVPSGTYYENIVIDKSISLIGENKNTTIIDGGFGDIVIIYADWVNISGFTIQNGNHGICIISVSYNTINGNNILNNTYGIELNKGYYGVCSYNNIIGNNISNNPMDGILSYGINNNIIEKNIFSKNKCGIELNYYSVDNKIIDNAFISNENHGISIINSAYNSVSGNTFISNQDGGINLLWHSNNITDNSFFNDGLNAGSHYHNNVENNTVNDKQLVCLYNESDLVIDVDAGQIILQRCEGITIQNQEIANTYIGISLINSHNCFISNNIINSNIRNGIQIISWSENNTIANNTINLNNENGILFDFSINSTIKDNNISNNDYGIHHSGGNSVIAGNTINSNNNDGILINGWSDNILTNNTIELNNGTGICLIYSNYNKIISNNISENTDGIIISSQYSGHSNIIYHNNFIDNTQNAFDDRWNNTWDDGEYGNYWSDYKERYPNASKIRSKGIWDTPYEIPGGDNKDMYPLINQYPKSVIKTKSIPKPFIFNFPLLSWLLDRFPLLQLFLRLLIL